MKCDHCGRDLETLEFECNKCGEIFCTQHRLPESHDCIGLKVEKAEQELKRSEGDEVPWFKDEFRLSNVKKGGHDRESSSSTDRARKKERYRETQASEECTKCGQTLFQHEAAGCPFCGEVYCGDHLSEHRATCSERDSEAVESATTVQEHYQKRTKSKQENRKTRTDEIEEERREHYSSPDMNPDGSLSSPDYEEDIQSIGSDRDQADRSTGSNNRMKIIVVTCFVGLLVLLGYLFLI